jgi:hypothetical protein
MSRYVDLFSRINQQEVNSSPAPLVHIADLVVDKRIILQLSSASERTPAGPGGVTKFG